MSLSTVELKRPCTILNENAQIVLDYRDLIFLICFLTLSHTFFPSRTRSPWPCRSCRARWCTCRLRARPCCAASPRASRGRCSRSCWPRRTSAPSTAARRPAACRPGPPAWAQVRRSSGFGFFFLNKIVRALSDSSSISSQRLLRSTAPRRSPCSAGSAPTGRRTARCATSRSASRPTSSPSETRTPPSRSPAASSSPRRSTLDTRVFRLHFPLC